jgi:hypothetical protein
MRKNCEGLTEKEFVKRNPWKGQFRKLSGFGFPFFVFLRLSILCERNARKRQPKTKDSKVNQTYPTTSQKKKKPSQRNEHFIFWARVFLHSIFTFTNCLSPLEAVAVAFCFLCYLRCRFSTASGRSF